jgi:hypothetical protein
MEGKDYVVQEGDGGPPLHRVADDRRSEHHRPVDEQRASTPVSRQAAGVRCRAATGRRRILEARAKDVRTQALPGNAGERFEEAVGLAFDDAMQRRLRYHLLRLTVVGLSRDEVPLMVEPARQAFHDADVANQAAPSRTGRV